MVIQVAIGPLHDPVPEDLPNGTRVSVVAIGGDPIGHHTGHGLGRVEDGLSCREVSGIAEPCVKQVAVSANRTVQVTPLSPVFDRRFIDVPALAHGLVAPLASHATQARG